MGKIWFVLWLFDLHKVNKLYMMCVKIYCEKGKPGVCYFAEHLAEMCDVKFGITVIGELEDCCKIFFN